MNKYMRLALSVAILVCMASVFAPRPASAHPMGNFSINQYSAITVASDHVDVLYIVDMAEIPTFSELAAIHEDRSTNLTQAERDAYIARKAGELMRGLSLSVNGKTVPLTIQSSALSFPPGQFSSPTLRLELNLSGSAAAAGKATLQYNDSNFTDRIGWKEIIANSAQGVKLTNSNVPAADLSDKLTKYSPDAINNRPTATSATVTFEPGVASLSAGSTSRVTSNSTGFFLTDWAQGLADWIKQQEQVLTNLLAQKDVPFGLLLFGLGLSFAMGAAHALSPGHGKTVVAAYLVGSRGTAWHALLLGLIVTFTHTVGVFLLGLVVLSLQQYVVPETLYPWLGFLSGVLIMIVGLVLFVQRFRHWRRSHATVTDMTHTHEGQTHSHGAEDVHDHSHDTAHDHSHDVAPDHNDPTVPHSHGPFSRPHTHLPVEGQKVSLGSLLALGISGGIIPCPSALVVLLVAVRLARVDLGLLLIVAFSLGLAVVLTAIGILMVYSRGLVSRIKFQGGFMARLPMASALMVSGLGILLAINSLGPR